MSINVTWEVDLWACSTCGAVFGALKGTPGICGQCQRRGRERAEVDANRKADRIAQLERQVRAFKASRNRK